MEFTCLQIAFVTASFSPVRLILSHRYCPHMILLQAHALFLHCSFPNHPQE